MKKNKINLIVRIFGIFLIIIGITLSVIPLFNFDVYTFKLLPVIIFALGFPFCGFILIIMSYIINIDIEKNTEDVVSHKNKK